jgi:hypothetical protein
MGISAYILVFLLGIAVGSLIKGWLIRRRNFVGTIHVVRERDKTLYSLELSDYPESIEFRKIAIFKVDTPEES